MGYTDANGKHVVTHYKSLPGKGTQMMTNNLPQDTDAVREAKEKFFVEFNAAKARGANVTPVETVKPVETAAKSLPAKGRQVVAHKGPQDTESVRAAKAQFFVEFNKRKAYHNRRRQEKASAMGKPVAAALTGAETATTATEEGNEEAEAREAEEEDEEEGDGGDEEERRMKK